MSSLRLAVLGALAATAAVAAPAQAKPIVHKVPKVPIVVDGVRYAPKQIHRFDGQPLYMRLGPQGKSLIATTKLSKFTAYLRTKGIVLPRPGTKTPPKAKAAVAGDFSKFCTEPGLRGWCHDIQSGWALSNTRAIDGCNPWTCWIYTNGIESVQSNGPGAVLFDWPNFNAGGGSFFLFRNETLDLS